MENKRIWVCITHGNPGKEKKLPVKCTQKTGCIFHHRIIWKQIPLF